MPRTRTVVAVGLIVLGVVAMAGPTFGFSTIASDRGVSIATADDPNANLGIEEAYNGQTITSGDAQPLVRLTNQFDEGLGGDDGMIAVEVVAVSGDIQDDDALMVDSAPSELDPDEGGNVDVICVDDSINGKNTVDVTLRVDEASGQTISVTDATAGPVTNVEIHCSKTEETQSGLTDVWASDLPFDQERTNQTFEFTLTSDLAQGETVAVSHDANQLDYDAATVSVRDDDGNGAVEFTDNNNRAFEYEASDGTVSEGTTVTIDVDGVDTTHNNADRTYDATFERSDESDTETVSFTVTTT